MHVWIRSEPLVNSAINFPISNHINANTLRKTVNYAKNKGTSGYPKIEYSIWRYIACNKISISEHVAWMYFESFFFMSNYGTPKNMDLDIELAKSKNKEEAEKFKEVKKVDLYQFIIYLYIQQFYSIDLKSSVMSREEWPVNRNDGANDRRKSKDEMNFINFITKNLDEIISLFLTEKSTNQHDIISEEIIQALNFLFEGSIDNYNGIMPFSLFLKQPIIQSKMSDGKVYGQNLVSFLKTYLEINPFGLNSCLRTGKRISPSYLGGSIDPRKVGKIITNCSSAPTADFIVFITQVLKQTLIEVSDTFRNAGLYIDKCVYSYIYILQPIRSCTIKKCRKSLLFIGPTQRTVTIDSCAECCIVTVCRRIIIRNCSSCTFFLLTPSSPILLSGCDNIKFAPFNSYYPNIDEDANASGLTSALNLWDKPIVVAPNHHSGGGGSASSSLQNHHHWSLMDPAEFSLLAVPVDSLPPKGQHNTSELVNRANEVFGTLPNDYEQELNKRYLNIEENLNLIQSASLNPEQKIMLQKFVETSFKENLQISGEQRQLDHLAIIYNNTNANAAANMMMMNAVAGGSGGSNNNSSSSSNNQSQSYTHMSSA